jgi:nicotinamidase-related amidase/type 1 glutamine amidotransferase
MNTRLLFLLCFCFIFEARFTSLLGANESELLLLNTRQRIKQPDGSFQVKEEQARWDPGKTALVICDMWDQHWCQGATARVAEMAPHMNEVVKEARRRGVFIIHAPSGTLGFYQGTPQRQLAQSAPQAEPKVPIRGWCSLDPEVEAPLPIDDSDGGCDDDPQCKQGNPWTRQIAAIEIEEGDAITDSAEAYYLMRERGIENLIVMGVHVNMCVLGRPFSIRQMVYQGMKVVLMRDLTDSMYNSRRKPWVSHFRGTDLVVEHIEKYWCPSITSADFLGGEPFRFKDDKRPHAAFIMGEEEFETARTLPEFARRELEPRGIVCTFIFADENKPNEFPGIEAAREADLLVLSVRRRTPPSAQLEVVRDHLAQGKPLAGLRTASHAFDARPPSDDHQRWPNFDTEVLGMKYELHYGNKPPEGPDTIARIQPGAADHPILTGISSRPMRFTSHLYRNRNPGPGVTTLLVGQVEGRSEIEPVAWINNAEGARVFYTSLGGPEDFEQLEFRRLLLNGILWSLNLPIPPEWVDLTWESGETQEVDREEGPAGLAQVSSSPREVKKN